MRERQRESNTQKTRFQNNALTQCTYVCVQCTRFIQVLTRTDRSTIVLQCSLRAPTQTPKYIPYGISFFASPIGPNRLGTRPNRSVHTDSVLGFFSRLCRCWACISTYILRLILIFGSLVHDNLTWSPFVFWSKVQLISLLLMFLCQTIRICWCCWK